MSDKFNEEQKADYRKVFNLFDKDKNGTLSQQEFARMVRLLGKNITDDEVKVLFAQVDNNHNGMIEFKEFLVLVEKEFPRINPHQALKVAFKLFDKNGDGKISHAELKEALEKLEEKHDDETIKQLLKEADLDGNGELNLAEFKKFMKKH